MHGVDDTVFDLFENPFLGQQEFRHDAENLSPRIMRRSRCGPHQAHTAASIDELQTVLCEVCSQIDGKIQITA